MLSFVELGRRSIPPNHPTPGGVVRIWRVERRGWGGETDGLPVHCLNGYFFVSTAPR